VTRLRQPWGSDNQESNATVGIQDCDLVLQLTKSDKGGRMGCEYYFVNHQRKALLWVHEMTNLGLHHLHSFQSKDDPEILGEWLSTV
jgi:hypothetical protein